VRWRYASAPYGSRDGAGENPPRGAIITYRLAEKPEGEITLEVLDADGALIRRLSSELGKQYDSPDHPDWGPGSTPEPELTADAGLNRVSWDLRYGEPKWMPDARFDAGKPRPDPPVVPGDYTLRLTVEGRSATQPLIVELDPRTSVSESDLKEELVYGLGVRAQLARIVDMVETIRGVRDQVKDRNARLADNPDASELVDLGKKLIADLNAVEEEIHNLHAEVDYDVLAGRHGGAKMYSRSAWLLEMSGDHDGPPTQGMLEVAADLEQELTTREAALAGLISEDLAKLNELAKEKDVPYVVAP